MTARTGQEQGQGRKHRTKNATDSHNLDSTKPANAEPEVEIGGFDMSFLDVDALPQQESDWIKIGGHRCRKDGMAPECHKREEASW